VVLNLRFRVLLSGGLLLWGLFDLVLAATGDSSIMRVIFGLAYLAVGGYQLAVRRVSQTPIPAVQRIP
jgi:hypothetical protein